MSTDTPEHELPYFDKFGKEIKEFAVIKMFHFKGTNEQGRGRKNYYMYKWVRKHEFKGKVWWVGQHLTDDKGGDFNLKAVADENRIIHSAEIVQQY